MPDKNPRAGGGARAYVSIAADTEAHTKTRPVLQSNPTMRLRLAALLWVKKWGAA